MSKYVEHRLLSVMPPMDSDDFENLLEDMKENGQQTPALVKGNVLIDGRHRAKACDKLGLALKVEQWDGDIEDDPTVLAVIMSLNLHRRHLSTGQRALLGVRIEDALRLDAGARQKKTQFGSKVEEAVFGTKTPFLKNATVPPTLAAPRGDARDLAAAAVEVSHGTLDHVRKAVKKGVPNLVAAINAKQVDPFNAASICELPPEEQEAVIAAGPKAMVDKAREIRETPRKASEPRKASSFKPIAARGLKDVREYLDERIDGWGRSKDEYAEKIFEELTVVRTELCGG